MNTQLVQQAQQAISRAIEGRDTQAIINECQHHTYHLLYHGDLTPEQDEVLEDLQRKASLLDRIQSSNPKRRITEEQFFSDAREIQQFIFTLNQ